MQSIFFRSEEGKTPGGSQTSCPELNKGGEQPAVPSLDGSLASSEPTTLAASVTSSTGSASPEADTAGGESNCGKVPASTQATTGGRRQICICLQQTNDIMFKSEVHASAAAGQVQPNPQRHECCVPPLCRVFRELWGCKGQPYVPFAVASHCASDPLRVPGS